MVSALADLYGLSGTTSPKAESEVVLFYLPRIASMRAASMPDRHALPPGRSLYRLPSSRV